MILSLTDRFCAVNEFNLSVHLIGDAGEIPVAAGYIPDSIQAVQQAFQIAVHSLDQFLNPVFVELLQPVGEFLRAVTELCNAVNQRPGAVMPSISAPAPLCSVSEPA